MPNITDITLASSTLLEQYESQGYDDLLQALFLANHNIEMQILKTKGQWTTRKLNEIKRLINAEIGNAYGGLFASMQDESVAIATINMNAVLGYSSLATALPKSAVTELISPNRSIQMNYNLKTKEGSTETLKDLFKITEQNHARQLVNTIRAGVDANLTSAQIVRQYGIKSNRLTKGKIIGNIFTVMSDAKNQGNYNAYEDLEKRGLIKYYEHVSTLDSNTSDTCIDLDGHKYYKTIDEIPNVLKPPIHVSCRSQLVARTEDDPQLRASQTGAVEDQTYKEWFSSQSKSFQRSVLGNKTYDLYQRGIYKVSGLPDAVGKRKKDLKQYQASLFDYVKDRD